MMWLSLSVISAPAMTRVCNATWYTCMQVINANNIYAPLSYLHRLESFCLICIDILSYLHRLENLICIDFLILFT